jgi:hypothetical protein
VVDGFAGLTLCDSVEAADWVRAALRPWDLGIHHVSTLVPARYFAHARVLHRPRKGADDIRWTDIAAARGRHLRGETQFAELIDWHGDAAHPSPPEPWYEPDRGSLRPSECAAVAAVLARHTTTPEHCWFCVWEGYGWPVLNRLGEGAPRVALEHRDCLLFHGPVSAATAFRSEPWFQSATLWWPEDRAWCVASELDIYSTYVAGTPSAVHELVEHPELEVLSCTAEQDIDHGPYAAWR